MDCNTIWYRKHISNGKDNCETLTLGYCAGKSPDRFDRIRRRLHRVVAMRPLLFAALLTLTLLRGASLVLWLRRRWRVYVQLRRLEIERYLECEKPYLTPPSSWLGLKPRIVSDPEARTDRYEDYRGVGLWPQN